MILAGQEISLLCLASSALAVRHLFLARNARAGAMDLEHLSEALYAALKNTPCPTTGSYATAVGQRSAMLLRHLSGKVINEEVRKAELLSSLGTAARITKASVEKQQTHTEIVSTIVQEYGEGCVACMSVTKTPEGVEVSAAVEAFRGRIEGLAEALQSYIEESVLEEGSLIELAGKNLPPALAEIGVSEALVLPYRLKRNLGGYLLVGLSSRASLSPAERERLRALIAHSVSCLEAAEEAEKKAKESQKEKDLLLGMSHDLKSPGNSALYAVDALLTGDGGKLNGMQKEYVEVVRYALNQQLTIVGDLLDFARHRRGILTAEPDQQDIAQLTSELLPYHRLQAEQRGIAVLFESHTPVPALIEAKHYRRIIDNLVSNAIKYSDRGQVSLVIKKRGRYWQVEVRDQGIGIKEENRAELFSTFARFDGAKKRPGAGLGLYISKTLAELNGATLHYEPNPEGGSVFILSVPACNLEEEAPSAAIVETILIIEDDQATLRTYKRCLKALANRVVVATTVEEAKAALLEQSPDIIISDLQLARDSALSFLQALPKSVPLLVVSGLVLPKKLIERENLIKLEKPITTKELKRACLKLLTRYKLSPEALPKPRMAKPERVL